jgi:uncharacterized protein (DUF924 family)
MTAFPTAAQEVLDFWFGAADVPGHGQPRQAWFRKDPAFDALIAERFGGLVERALAGGLGDWAGSPLSALARVIVLDQFPRNLFRGQARAFAGDTQALQAAQAMVAAGTDRTLTGVQRQFVYLPFEHSESITVQRESLRLFAQLGRDEPAQSGLLEWAQRHHDIVERFGRFPHRNQALGRASTAEELAFLATPGSSF